MSTNYIHIGTLNDHSQDHSRHMTISASGADVNSIVRAFFAEDVEEVKEDKPEPKQEYFPFLTKKCFEEKKVELVEAEFRAACKGTAESLWRSLWDNENIGYVEVKPYDATTIYRRIEKWYGKLPYSERNFRGARNKR